MEEITVMSNAIQIGEQMNLNRRTAGKKLKEWKLDLIKINKRSKKGVMFVGYLDKKTLLEIALKDIVK